MTLTARQARTLDPLAFILTRMRWEAGCYIVRAKRLIEKWEVRQ